MSNPGASLVCRGGTPGDGYPAQSLQCAPSHERRRSTRPACALAAAGGAPCADGRDLRRSPRIDRQDPPGSGADHARRFSRRLTSGGARRPTATGAGRAPALPHRIPAESRRRGRRPRHARRLARSGSAPTSPPIPRARRHEYRSRRPIPPFSSTPRGTSPWRPSRSATSSPIWPRVSPTSTRRSVSSTP